jgi:L-ascorbate metabolism protein UlaG (beta-lactamase superfamily)
VIRSLLLTVAATGAVALSRAARGVPTAIGASRRALRQVTAGSPRSHAGTFHNALPATVLPPASNAGILRLLLARDRPGRPAAPVPLAPVDLPDAAGALAVTWFGHSTTVLEVDGHRVLTDPMWSDRASPSRLVGPQRMHPVPAPLHALPGVDAILISHDHYDHLDLPTVQSLLSLTAAPFVVPLGIGAHLRAWGVPGARLVELDWDESVEIGDLTLTCCEARHFSGRGLARNTTLWASWAVAGRRHRAFFGGDTGFTPAFAEIGERVGPFGLTLLPVGAYSELWPDVHMTPEEAVRAHRDLGGGLLVPVHWGTFNLGFHGWSEPVERLRSAALAEGVAFAVPRPGDRVDCTEPAAVRDWWSAVG